MNEKTTDTNEIDYSDYQPVGEIDKKVKTIVTMLCDLCNADMKEYPTKFKCRACHAEYKKEWPIGGDTRQPEAEYTNLDPEIVNLVNDNFDELIRPAEEVKTEKLKYVNVDYALDDDEKEKPFCVECGQYLDRSWQACPVCYVHINWSKETEE